MFDNAPYPSANTITCTGHATCARRIPPCVADDAVPAREYVRRDLGESTFPGRLFKVALDGTVLGVIGRSRRQLKQFSGVHQLACPSENEVYTAETSNWRVQKLLLKPTARATASASRPCPDPREGSRSCSN